MLQTIDYSLQGIKFICITNNWVFLRLIINCPNCVTLTGRTDLDYKEGEGANGFGKIQNI